MNWPKLTLFLEKKKYLSKSEVADIIELYVNNPNLSMQSIGDNWSVSPQTISRVISDHYFGIIKGEKETITMTSKFNNEILEETELLTPIIQQ